MAPRSFLSHKKTKKPPNPLETYRESHRHPLNRALHSVGIPLIVVSVLLAFFAWKWALGLFVFGWLLQFAGHAAEGKAPVFLRHPKYLFVGVYWWGRKMLGRELPGPENQTPRAK
ncbi:MAG: DUF962 domain-containing protein [Bdellovibrionales bacterium]|nr:DUF962 domain-containing protein [Bdellovibrionales bacterium]